MSRMLLYVVVASISLIPVAAPARGEGRDDTAFRRAHDSVKQFFNGLLAGEPLPADAVYVHVSEPALKRILRRPVSRQATVNDTIVGTPVQGTAITAGQTDVRLIPAKHRGVIDLLFEGQVRAQTTGLGGPVRVYSTSVTRFSAVKRLILDEQGIKMLPSQGAARTSITIDDVTTDLPGIRGRIARRVGSRRAAERRLAAQAESARKAEARIAKQFDREVANQLSSARGKLSQELAVLLNDGDLHRSRLEFATSQGHLQVAVHRADGDWARRPPPALATLGSPDLAIHAHSSLVKRALQNTILQGQIDPRLNALLAGERPQYVSLVEDEPRTQLKQSSDGKWWSLVIRELQPEK